MISPAHAHRERMLAAASAASAGDPINLRSGAAASEYELMRARLGVDLRRLKEIQSQEWKIALKRELLPGYAAWVEGALEGGAATADGTNAPQDDIVVTIMIWLLDTGDFAVALPLCAHVLRHKLVLPERFNRTPATLITEETAEAALKSLGQGQAFDLAVLEEIEALVAEEDMPDQVRAKLEKAIGLEMARRAEATAADADGPAGARRAECARALARLRRANELDGGSGVKTKIGQLERELAKLPAAEEP